MVWNAMSGYDVTTTTYSFTDKPLTVTHTHTSSSASLTEVTTYAYDSADHLKKVQHKLDNGSVVTLAEYSYDNFGRLSSKKQGGTLHTSTYAYNNGFEFKDGVKQANEYVYDSNGILTKDLNKGISGIQYNVLNLPVGITFASSDFIQYGYTADGIKRRMMYKEANGSDSPVTTVYCGNVIYEGSVAKLLLTEEGYVTLSDKKYHYYLKGHLGNNRVVFNSTGTVEETNHYYPFGGVFASTGNI